MQTFLDRGDATARILAVVKNFEKVSRVALTLALTLASTRRRPGEKNNCTYCNTTAVTLYDGAVRCASAMVQPKFLVRVTEF